MGKVSATLRVDGRPAFGAQVAFDVDATVSKASDLYLLWVANKCYQGGRLVSVEYLPVHDGIAGPFTLGPAPQDGGPQGDWSGGAADGKAYVFVWPATSTAVRGSTLTYPVEG